MAYLPVRRGFGDAPMAGITSVAQLADSNGNVLAYDQGLQKYRMVPASQAKLAGCTSQGTNMGLWSINPDCGCVGQTFVTTNPASVPSNVDPRIAPCSFTPVVTTPTGYQPITGAGGAGGAGTVAAVGQVGQGSASLNASSGAGLSFLDSAMAWIQANPLYAALGAGAILLLVVKR